MSEQFLAELSTQMADAVELAARSVVQVNARQRFPASGIAIAPDLVLTADHVVEREEGITVGTPDDRELAARLVGRDAASDVALLRVAAGGLTPAQRADLPARVGQLILMIGRPTRGGPMASLGIISALAGPWRNRRGAVLEQVLRTDATPYPGFSGGALITTAGTVVGMTTTGLLRGPAVGIPAAVAWSLAEALLQHGSVKRGYLGILSQPVRLPEGVPAVAGAQPRIGLLLMRVEPGSPAAQAGLLIGDILVAINGRLIEDVDDLQAMLGPEYVGQTQTVEIIRGGELRQMQVVVGARG
ncbi:S1C family serine protease [Kallotenue papyrolyticum]|uniref:S1C family serine protease n=1 Tax=Kallotenue papyrolyticum TaxID=1325125 RepID=UPI00047867F2|nr:S1C family serine protease [Kallotenue papyrolyticum]